MQLINKAIVAIISLFIFNGESNKKVWIRKTEFEELHFMELFIGLVGMKIELSIKF